jgi:hypothetical protein
MDDEIPDDENPAWDGQRMIGRRRRVGLDRNRGPDLSQLLGVVARRIGLAELGHSQIKNGPL